MSNETCGHPTADGTPCQHPTTDDGDSGRCWIPDHNDSDVDTEAGGREFTITEADHDDILEAARLGASKAGCARAAGVSHSQLNRYLENHDEFRSAFTQARAKGEQRLIRGPLFNDPEPHTEEMDGQHARFLLSTSFDYNETKEVEHAGEGGGPLELSINREVVGDDDGD